MLAKNRGKHGRTIISIPFAPVDIVKCNIKVGYHFMSATNQSPRCIKRTTDDYSSHKTKSVNLYCISFNFSQV